MERNFRTRLFSWNVHCEGVVGSGSPRAGVHREKWQIKMCRLSMGHAEKVRPFIVSATLLITDVVVPVYSHLFLSAS